MTNEELLKKIEALEGQVSALQKKVKYQSYYTDMMEIQQLMARYIYILETGGGEAMARVWDELFVHDDERVRLEVGDSGAYLGTEHVKRAFYTMANKVDMDGNPVDPAAKKGQLSQTNRDRAALLLMLTISTPCVVVDPDGQHARGHWHLFGPHTNRVFDAECGQKKDTAFWIAGKYDNEFVKVDGQWKFLKLRPIFWLRTPYHKSFLECPDCRRTPSPYWPPDEPARISSFNPDEGPNPDKWGPFLVDAFDYHEYL